MNIGIVTTWFERGAAYVSKQFEEVLSEEHEIFIYARGGEEYAGDNPKWNRPNVTWGKNLWLPTVTTPINKKDFLKWVTINKIEAVIFNEQHWWEPLLWCNQISLTTIAYIDYYKENTIPLFGIYDYLICNTKRHFKTFSWHPGARYIPWGTNIDIFKPKDLSEYNPTFFHSAGMAPFRKGTDILLRAFAKTKSDWKLIIHTQTSLERIGNELFGELIKKLIDQNRLQIIEKAVPAPGLYHLGSVYVYPSRLDGIGLTVAESISCGLVPILPDNAPMNEFVHQDYTLLVPVKKIYSRSDGYYWPIAEVTAIDLQQKMEEVVTWSENKITESRKNLVEYAKNNLSWKTNSKELLKLIREVQSSEKREKSSELIQHIKEFSNHGHHKLNKYIIRGNPILRPLVKYLKSILQ